MQLSPHFSFEELTFTQVRSVSNIPPAPILVNLEETARRMEDIRDLLNNHPIIITSGYRSQRVNEIVGGQPNSAHMSGFAVDFVVPDFGSVREVWHAIKDSTLEFDQLICEGALSANGNGGSAWVHLSFAPPNRMMAFDLPTVTRSNGHPQKDQGRTT